MELTPAIERLLGINAEHSQLFLKQQPNRRQYREIHPTAVGVLQCMDGRINIPLITETPLGVIRLWRSLGGQFDLGWGAFQRSIGDWFEMHRRQCLLLVTYHFAQGKQERGCRGFNYDQDQAVAFTAGLKGQFDRVFGGQTPYVVQVGIETDSDALILHGANGEAVNVAETNQHTLSKMLLRLYPDMPAEIRLDFRPLLSGNIQHVQAVKTANRPIEALEHREWVLGVGRGFDWLHRPPNTAIIVGPFNPNLSLPIGTAAHLLLKNLNGGRTNGEGIALVTCTPYRDQGYRRNLAIEKAASLHRFALEIITRETPELRAHLSDLAGVVNMHTRQLEPIEL